MHALSSQKRRGERGNRYLDRALLVKTFETARHRFLRGTDARMDDLLVVIGELGLELHPDRISTVASKIETLGSVEQFALTRSSFGPNADKELVGRLDRAWRNSKDTSPRDVASALRGGVRGGDVAGEPWSCRNWYGLALRLGRFRSGIPSRCFVKSSTPLKGDCFSSASSPMKSIR